MLTPHKLKDPQVLQLESNFIEQSSAVKAQLMKIDSLQAKIKQMQIHLNCLSKVQKQCDKKNKNNIQNTFLTIRNRVNITQSHMKIEKLHKNIKKHGEVQKNKVKQLRQKQIHELQMAKQQNLKFKLDLMKEVKQISQKNKSMIKKRKQQQLQKNKLSASTIKSQKQAFKQSVIQQKLRELKQKHQYQMNMSRLRISKQSSLACTLSQLMKQKQQIESRVQQKQQYNKKLQQLYKEIGRMNDKDIAKTIKEIKRKIKHLQDTQTDIELENNQDYVKFKMFQKYFQLQQKQRDQKENSVY